MCLKNSRKHKKVEKITHSLTTQTQPLLAFSFISFWSFSIHFFPAHVPTPPEYDCWHTVFTIPSLCFGAGLLPDSHKGTHYHTCKKPNVMWVTCFDSHSDESIGDDRGNVITDWLALTPQGQHYW